MPKIISSRRVIRILCHEFGFFFVSQKGSHIKLRKITTQGNIVTIVPNHSDVSPGTLKSILQLAKVDEKDFFDRL